MTPTDRDRPCSVCQQRLDAVAWSIGRHPNCGPYKPLTNAAYDRLVAHLTHSLGAAEIASTTTKEICMTDPRSAGREEPR